MIVWGPACSWQTSDFAKTLCVPPKTSHEAQSSLPDRHKTPPAQPEREILGNALHCHWEIPEGFTFPSYMRGEKKPNKIIKRPKEAAKLTLRGQPHDRAMAMGARQPKPNCPPRAWSHPVAGVPLPGLAQPSALLSQPLCRQISFTAMAKSLPELADILAALNQRRSRPSQPSEQPCK